MSTLEEIEPKHLSNKENNQLEIDDDNNDGDNYSYAMQLASSHVISMSMQTAIDLGIFEIIDRAGPKAKLSALEIASRLSCKNPEAPFAIDRILRLLASHAVLQCSIVEQNNQGLRSFRRLYGLASVAKYFVPNTNGASLGPFMALSHDKVFLQTWPFLKDAILEGGIAFNKVHGSHAFEYTSLDSRFNEVFNKAMVNQSTIVVNKILESYKGFNDINTLVDVGGGLGIALKFITSQYPHIHAINFDLPHVIQHASPYPGVQHIGGDMFESVPKGDAIFMKWILHDWSDEQCLKLLKNCYDAIPNEGKVIVVEAIVPIVLETSAYVKSIFQLDIAMMTQIQGGKERTQQEFLDLAKIAGFSGIRFECNVCNFWVMEFFK
ncbi:caffeic acid 3-O-methyltransferase-like [Senna tora]|uniref:caffeate O-methyltransferase n=1 Tax=Senna tora TaxID=362788 RepID=A0A834XG49_9FABA|nr:caffeic acid 3-O-methyltransferase-like [Senna tora]